MARYVQVGVMAHRDPITRDVVDEVPLYVDTDYKPYTPMSENERKQLVMDLAKKFKKARQAARVYEAL